MKIRFIAVLTIVLVLFSGCKTAKREEIPSLRVLAGDLEMPGENAVVSKKLEEKLGIRLDYIESIWEKRHDKLEVLTSAGNTPDLFSYGYTYGDKVERLVNQNIVLDLSPYLNDYPNIKKRINEFEFIKSSNDGRVYFIPIKINDSDEYILAEHAWFYRKDIIDSLGLELPRNAEEFYLFLKQIREKRPDSYPFTIESKYFLYAVFDLFDARLTDYEMVDGKWRATAINDNMKQAVRFLKRLWDEGLLDREFMLTPNWDNMFEKFLTGASPVIYTNYKYDKMAKLYAQRYPGSSPLDAIAYIPVMTNTSGEKRVSGTYNFYGGLYLKDDGNEALIRKRLELADYMLSPEGMLLMRYGVEGVHYEMRDGKPYSLLGQGSDGSTVRIRDIDGSATIKALVNYDNLYVDDQTLYKNFITQMKAEYHRYAYVSKNYNNYLPSGGKGIDVMQLEDFAIDTIIRLISESGDFDAEWEEFKRQYNEKGGNKIAQYLTENN